MTEFIHQDIDLCYNPIKMNTILDNIDVFIQDTKDHKETMALPMVYGNDILDVMRKLQNNFRSCFNSFRNALFVISYEKYHHELLKFTNPILHTDLDPRHNLARYRGVKIVRDDRVGDAIILIDISGFDLRYSIHEPRHGHVFPILVDYRKFHVGKLWSDVVKDIDSKTLKIKGSLERETSEIPHGVILEELRRRGEISK